MKTGPNSFKGICFYCILCPSYKVYLKHLQYLLKGAKLAKTNFQYEKRQKELEKKKKKEEKLKRKAEKGSVDEVTGEIIGDDADESGTTHDSPTDATPGSTETTPS